MKTEKISLSQLTILTAIFTFGTSILVIASILAMQVDQDAWIASIVGMSVNMLLIFLYIGLIKLFPGLTLTQMIEAITGKIIGKAISFLYVCYFFILTVYLIRLVGSFIVSAIFPETPIFVIYLTFTLVVAIAVRYGLETFSRAAELFAPFIVVFFLFIFIALLPQIDSRMIQPFFEAGFKPIMSAGFQIAAIQEHICLLMLIPSVTRAKRVPKALLLGTLIGSIIIVFVTTISMLVLGPEITARNLFPAFVLAKKISIGNFLERVEVVMTAIWFLAVFVKTAVSLFATVLSLSQTLNMNNYRAFTYPLSILVVVYAMLVFPNAAAYLHFLTHIWFYYSHTMLLVIPLLLFLIAWIQKRKKKDAGMNSSH